MIYELIAEQIYYVLLRINNIDPLDNVMLQPPAGCSIVSGRSAQCAQHATSGPVLDSGCSVNVTRPKDFYIDAGENT